MYSRIWLKLTKNSLTLIFKIMKRLPIKNTVLIKINYNFIQFIKNMYANNLHYGIVA